MKMLSALFCIVSIILTCTSAFSEQLKCAFLFNSKTSQQINTSPILTDFFHDPQKFDRIEYLKTLYQKMKKTSPEQHHKLGGHLNLELDADGNIIQSSNSIPHLPHTNLLKLSQFLDSYPEQFQALILDRGLLHHADAFINFLKNCSQCKDKDPWVVREMARNALGKKIVYRAVFINEQSLKKIQAEGFIGRIFSQKTDLEEKSIIGLSKNYQTQMYNHMGNSATSPYISVTEYPEVAIAVARRFREGAVKGSAIYLFKLEIPILDMTYLDYLDAPTDSIQIMDEKYEVTGQGKTLTFNMDERLESLVLFRILPSEILSIKKYQRAPFQQYD